MENSKVMEGSKLSEVYTDLFILATQLRKAGDYGEPDTLRRRIIEMFEKTDQKGRGAGISEDAMQHARYALAAFIDETILSSPWPQKDQWSSDSLQYHFFREHLAGVEFFNRLETLRRASPPNSDILGIYYLCLVMGFEGQYKLHGKEKLKGIVDELSRQIQGGQGILPPLSPHGKRPDEFIEVVKRGLPTWVIVVSCASVIFFFYLALSFMISHNVSSAVENLNQILEGR